MRSIVTEPVPVELAARLRCAVLDHARSERRRVHPPVLHAGVPRGGVHRFEPAPEDRLDHTARVDVVLALLARWHRVSGPGPGRGPVDPPLLWLTRALVDDERAARVELPWLAAVDQARAELGEAAAEVPFVVVHRRGWHDPHGGASRYWARIRPLAAEGR